MEDYTQEIKGAGGFLEVHFYKVCKVMVYSDDAG